MVAMMRTTTRSTDPVMRFLDIPTRLVGGGHNNMLSHECLSSKRLTIDIHRYPEGGFSNPNVHNNFEQVYVVLEGEGEAIVAGLTQSVGVRSIIFIPRNSLHSIRNTGTGELVLAFISVTLD
jgi:mannose-6-phosphate isomerase-like protein (cupin superfamily)